VFPYTLPELPKTLMLVSAILTGSLIFTEYTMAGPGLGYLTEDAINQAHDVPLFHVSAMLIALVNVSFWMLLTVLNIYFGVISYLYAQLLDRLLIKRN